ncbi:glucose-1-phosphate cytidylyltransferase [Candidatus Moduliflexus flocculans]|uniref:Glucose-1-phosphate cytidylyltransferase n=1 Tax=Candidatus Moduliflexus flocculans TaxID=1499966 RepID=A0A081BMU0_9BACT|nr:glucose-1-phosphate cytidylyltransferase [Candidatus Moduliflexus flocculans]
MKVGILAGGLGSRLQEETVIRPKPMVEIGGYPILWHIMKIYAAYGFREFVIALGYKGEVIKDYFLNYRYRVSNLTIETGTGHIKVHEQQHEDWIIHLLNTGGKTETGGRIKQIAQFIGNETFMLTYGDGVANVNIRELLNFHLEQKKLATITAVRPPARFGNIVLVQNSVKCFEEKPQSGDGWINGGFLVLEPQVAAYISGEQTIFERDPLEQLARDGQLAAYLHDGFWQCMDTLRDMRLLESLWQEGQALWKVW